MGNGMESTPLKVRYLTLTVPPELAGTEVNTLLRRHLGLSGTVLRRIKWLEDGITLDGVRVHVRVRVSPGQVLSARLSDPDTAGQPWPSQGALDIVYEDEDLAVVNKAPGMLVHPSHGHYADTVGNHLMGHYLDRREAAGFHPVHRLDKGTSGLLVTAKHPYGQEKLRNQLHTGDFRRVYLAVCRGVPHPLAGTIDAPIGPREGSLTAQQVRPDGKPARTHYRVLRDLGGALVELELDTGRTHQIRVHMAHMSFPLTGDALYGGETGLIPRPALHSARVELTHPVTGARLVLDCPLPEDIRALIPSSSSEKEC